MKKCFKVNKSLFSFKHCHCSELCNRQYVYLYVLHTKNSVLVINCNGSHVCDQHTMFIKMSKFVILCNYESTKCSWHHFDPDSVVEHDVIIIMITLGFEVLNQIISWITVQIKNTSWKIYPQRELNKILHVFFGRFLHMKEALKYIYIYKQHYLAWTSFPLHIWTLYCS